MPATPSAQSDSKRRERIALLCDTADNVCFDLTGSTSGRANPTREAFYYEKSDISAAIDDYFDAVDAFKYEHAFDDHLINPAKQAAITVFVVMKRQIIMAHRNVPDTVHLSMANAWYAYRVAINILNLRLDQIEDDIAEELIFRIRFGYEDIRATILICELTRRAYKGRRWTRFIPSLTIFTGNRKIRGHRTR